MTTPARKMARACPAVSTSGESGRITSGTFFVRVPASDSSPAAHAAALSARSRLPSRSRYASLAKSESPTTTMRPRRLPAPSPGLPISAMTTNEAEPGVSWWARDGSSPRRARAGSAIAHAVGAVRAMLSASTPGTSAATSTVRADGSTAPLWIGLAVGSDTGFPCLKSSTTAAQPDARAGEEAREVRERRRIEEEEDGAPALQVAGELVELREEEVVLRSGHDHQVRLRRHSSVEQRVALDDVVLLRERTRQAAVALRAAARRPLAVAGGERDAARLPAQRAQDAARKLLLGQGRRDRASAGVFDRRPPVLRDAEGPCPIGVAV